MLAHVDPVIIIFHGGEQIHQNRAFTQSPRLRPVEDNVCLSPRAPASRKAYRACGVSLWKLPAKSPDLNPVEKYWSWLRRRMRAMDLADQSAKRPALGKAAYKARLFLSGAHQEV